MNFLLSLLVFVLAATVFAQSCAVGKYSIDNGECIECSAGIFN